MGLTHEDLEEGETRVESWRLQTERITWVA